MRLINRREVANALFALVAARSRVVERRKATHVRHNVGSTYAHDIPRTLHLIHGKDAFEVLRAGLTGVDSVTRTWIRRTSERRFGAEKMGKPDRDPIALQPEGAGVSKAWEAQRRGGNREAVTSNRQRGTGRRSRSASSRRATTDRFFGTS